MTRGAWLVAGCWLAASVGCEREAAVEASGGAAAEQPSAEVSKTSEPAGDRPTSPRAKVEPDAEDPGVAPRADDAKASAAPPPAAGDAKPAVPAAPVEPAPMSRDEPELRMLPAPPLAYTLYAEAPVKQGPQPTLVVISAKRNGVIDEERWFERNGLALPTWDRPPMPPRVHPPGHSFSPFRKTRPPVPPPAPAPVANPLPPEVPLELAGARIAEAIRGRGCSIALYPVDRVEHRVVVRDDVGEVLGAFDFAAYGHVPGDGGHSRQYIEWAQVQDGVLFVSTRHLGYASDSGGLNAFLTAIELGSGQLLWRSEPLVSNSYTFLVRDGWIITGYGYTAEPDFLFVLDGKTGEVVQRLPVKSGPEYILEKDGVIHVRTYDHDYRLKVETK